VARGGRLLSHFQNGRVQNYLRVIAVALVVLAAILLWGRRRMITLLTLLPIVGGFAVLALARSRDLARAIGIVFATGALAIAVLFCYGLRSRDSRDAV